VNGTSTPGTVYNYTIGSGGASGYAANGNLVSYTDLMNGGWSLSYDNVNRVSTATATSGVWNNLTLSWTYDSFGNRETQTPSGQNIAAPVPQAQTLSYPSQNRMSNYGINGYDAAGNVLYDQINSYLYDAEGRLCAVSYFDGMSTKYMLYLYDGEGRRVAKVSNPTFSCTPASTGSILQETYLLGPSGEHITELGQAGAFVRSNVYANGQLLATYTNNGTYFSLNDWLGSKRVVAKYDGTKAQMCMNLPFGDDLMCSATDLSEHHFTGQIYDQETKNDYFNARYYSNNTGRFLSPDYDGTGDSPEPIPYADPSNPQSLNLYAYVTNNPLGLTDPDGHGCDDDQATWGSDVSLSTGGGDVSASVFVVNGNCNPAPVPLAQVQSTTQINPQKNTPSPAPNNATPWYNTCTASALFSGAGSIAIDSIGLIPEAEGFTKVFENTAGYQLARAAGNSAGYRGVVATQYGMRAVTQGKGGAALISGALGLGDTSVQGRLTTGLTVAGFVPGLGTLAAGTSIVNDAIKTGMAVAKCP
jgi:RHS repeat-associated protein